MKKHRVFILFIAFIWLSQNWEYSFAAQNVTIFTYRAPESQTDLRYNYDNKLLKLALEKTVETDGPYLLVPSPIMNYARAQAYVKSNSLPNLILKLSYDPDFENRDMGFVPFPVDLGIVGYRVCFAHPEISKALSQVDSLEDLRGFSHGQGTGWSDVDILRHNGFNAIEIPNYESLFNMVALRRFDLFCRGANELLDEMKTHQHIQNLSYDKSMILFYPFPRFFYTNAANSSALERIQRGLEKSYEDGSLQSLWRQHYKASIDFVELDQRRVFTLENPLVEHLDFDYQKYFYNPQLTK